MPRDPKVCFMDIKIACECMLEFVGNMSSAEYCSLTFFFKMTTHSVLDLIAQFINGFSFGKNILSKRLCFETTLW